MAARRKSPAPDERMHVAMQGRDGFPQRLAAAADEANLPVSRFAMQVLEARLSQIGYGRPPRNVVVTVQQSTRRTRQAA